MKIIINRSYGLFRIPEKIIELLGLDGVYFVGENMSEKNIAIRTNPIFIEFVEKMNVKERFISSCELRVVEIPEEATDWEILEYDGLETIIAVVDGKIKKIFR